MRNIVKSFVAVFATLCMVGAVSAAPTIVSPADYSTVSTMSENLKSIIQSADMLKTATFATGGTATRKMYSNEYCNNSLPVKLEWTGDAASYTVSVYRTRDIESGDAKALYSVTTSENSILYWDPEVGRNYTWTVDDGSSVAVGHFYTLAGVPRLIYADKNGPDVSGMDCLNGRDLGGWATTDGKVVKQSMIYRSAELETCSPTNSIGMRIKMPYLADVLGIKLDIDLRSTNEVQDTYLDYALYYSAWKDLEISNICPDIRRYSAHLNANSSFPSYAKAIIPNSTTTEKKRANIWNVFEQFTIEDNYPIIFHCAHGKDRAGTVGYILLSVLGVPADDAKRDFGLSWLYYVDEAMGDSYGYTPIEAAVENFPSYGGDSLKEQCENYLVVCARDAGVSETVAREKIAKFRSLMLEEPDAQIISSVNETVTYTWTGNGGDNKWANPANWASPEDSYAYPNADNAVVHITAENAYIDLEGATYKAMPIFGEEVKSVIFANGTLEVVADAFTLGAADMVVTLNSNAKIVASGALKILGTLNVVIPEGGRDLPISAASLAADTAAKINLDLTDFSSAGEVTLASFGEAFDSAAALEYTFTVAGNTVADRGAITTPESKAIVYSQDKKTGVISLPNAATGLVYTGEELVGVPAGEGYTLAGDYKAVNAGTYTAQVVLKDGYSLKDATDGTVTWTIAKADNEWVKTPQISLDTWNIGEAGGVLTPGATKFATVAATISKDGGEAQEFNGQLPTTKGSYVITYTASNEGTDNYSAIPSDNLSKSVSFTITANPSDLVAYAGYVTYPEPIFFVNGMMKLGEGITTAKIKYSINDETCNNVKEVTVDENGCFRVNIPYVNAEDTLTWEVEVVNSASAEVLTVEKSTLERSGDPSRVKYKWRGKGATNKWRSLANWEGFSGTVGNNNPCCWGYPGSIFTHVHFDQSTDSEGIDLEGQTWNSIDNGFFVFEENVFVKMKNGTLNIPSGYTTFENKTVGLIGANGSTLVLNNVKLDNMKGRNLIPASGFTLVYEGDNTVDWKYNPTKSNSKFIVRDGTLRGNIFNSTDTIDSTHVVEISNGVWSVTNNISNAKGIGATVIFRDGADREAQFITTGSLMMYGTYDIKIPADGRTNPAVQAKTLSSCSSSKIVLDVTDYKSATKVPLVKFTSTTAQTAPTSTLEAYADGVKVTSERGAKLTFEDNVLYYSQNAVTEPGEEPDPEEPGSGDEPVDPTPSTGKVEIDESYGYVVSGLGDGRNEYAVVFTNHTETATWTVPANLENVQFLVVGGGGGGGASASSSASTSTASFGGGGGGGGGVVTGSIINVVRKDSILTVGVGEGGKGGLAGKNKDGGTTTGTHYRGEAQSKGGYSWFAIDNARYVYVEGGGRDRGIKYNNTTSDIGMTGGDGGSCAGWRRKYSEVEAKNFPPNLHTEIDKTYVSVGLSPLGNYGGACWSDKPSAAGGGGGACSEGTASKVDKNGSTTTHWYAGDGGKGLISDITGAPIMYGAGGGGGVARGSDDDEKVTAGSAFAGAGAGAKNGKGGDGSDNQGGGGGGGRAGNGGNGGSGIVVLRFALGEAVEPEEPVVPEVVKIEKPTVQTSFTYDGSEKVAVAEGENYTITGTAKAIEAGTYTVTITPNEGFVWADDTTDAITVEWTIVKPADPEPPAPEEPELPKPVLGTTTNPLVGANGVQWGYTVSGLGEFRNETAVVFTNENATAMNWTAADNYTDVKFLVVGGGGGGGGDTYNHDGALGGAGGGGGGVITGLVNEVASGTVLTVTVGKGGLGGIAEKNTNEGYGSSTAGLPSTFGVGSTVYVTADGGGRDQGGTIAGAQSIGIVGGNGGSSAGSRPGITERGEATQGSVNEAAASLLSNVQKFGTKGGASEVRYAASGGGGAVSEGGVPFDEYTPGYGGEGLKSDITGTDVVYGSGGGGGSAMSNGYGGKGGTGAGNGHLEPKTDGVAALANQGGGGGGAGGTKNGGAGGSGIVVFRYTEEGGTIVEANVLAKIAAQPYTAADQVCALVETPGYTVKSATGKELGEYDVTLTPKAGYVWEDGSTEAKTFKWTIVKAENSWVVEPSISKETWVKGAEAGVLAAAEALVGNDTMTITVSFNGAEPVAFNGTMPTEVGEYAITYSVAGTESYSGLEKTVVFEITAEELTLVEKPSVDIASGAVFLYNGSVQKPVVTPAESDAYQVTYEGDFIAPGTHIIRVALNDGFKWSDETISPLVYTYEIEDRELTNYYWGGNGTWEDIYQSSTSWYSNQDRTTQAETYPDSYDALIYADIPAGTKGYLKGHGQRVKLAGAYVSGEYWMECGLYHFQNKYSAPITYITVAPGAYYAQYMCGIISDGVGCIDIGAGATLFAKRARADENTFIRFNTTNSEGATLEVSRCDTISTYGWFEGGSADGTSKILIKSSEYGAVKFTDENAVNGVAGPLAIDVGFKSGKTDTLSLIEVAGVLNINPGSTLAVDAGALAEGTYTVLKAKELNDTADLVKNGTVRNLKSGTYGTLVKSADGNTISLVITTSGPYVGKESDNVKPAPDKVFDYARESKAITYPSTPSLSGEVGSQVITWGGINVNVPEYYTATLNGNVLSLKLNNLKMPRIANKVVDGVIVIPAIKIEGDVAKIHLEDTYPTIYYTLESSAKIGEGESWTTADGNWTDNANFEYTITEDDPIRFFRVGKASDEPIE